MAAPRVTSALRIPADLLAVAFVRSTLACLLERERWPADGALRVLLAATEATANAIEHGSPPGGTVEVQTGVGRLWVTVRVVDEGRPGAPAPRWPDAPPTATSPRGRGLVIIRGLADEARLGPAGAGTEVRLGFARAAVAGVAPPPAAAAGAAQ